MKTKIKRLSSNRKIPSWTEVGRQWGVIAIWLPLKIASVSWQRVMSILQGEDRHYKTVPTKGIKTTGKFQVNGIKHIAKFEVNGFEFLSAKEVSSLCRHLTCVTRKQTLRSLSLSCQ